MRNSLLVVLVMGLAFLVSPIAGEAKSTKKKSTKRVTTTLPRQKPVPLKRVWMCDLVSRISLVEVPGLVPGPLLGTGLSRASVKPDDWRKEDPAQSLKRGADVCAVYYNNAAGDLAVQVDFGQEYANLSQIFVAAPSWAPTYKWQRVQISGITETTYRRKIGWHAVLGNTAAPECQIGVASARGVFKVSWSDFTLADNVQADGVSCDGAEESMRRMIAGLDAGGFQYFPDA